jgi:Family of unknown function (DUF5681)
MSDESKSSGRPPEDLPPNPAATPPEEEKVGPGHPPKRYRWTKGMPSPYPQGRPRKKPSMAPDLKKALEDALNAKVTLTKDRRAQTLSKAKLGIEQLVNQFAKGDRYARRDLMAYARELGVDLLAGSRKAIEDALVPNHQAILDAYVSRRTGTAETAPCAPVIAPPELLDDDVVKQEPTSAAPPTTTANPAPQPAITPGAAPARPAITPDSLGAPSTRSDAPLTETVAAPSPIRESTQKLETPLPLGAELRETPSRNQAPPPPQPNAAASAAPRPSPTVPPPEPHKPGDSLSGSKPLPLPPKPKHPPGGATRAYINALREWNLAVQRIQQSSSET